ncbi:glycosyltransferase family 4 protein [Neobacillus kokaensis]|uniref:Glycosyltransferase WbuB n=1 Tax=Neobacillus kokaensis TaxID=2759023 RepID=A0ABQ3N1J3_9BACI|nr:glycosyltransferase family 4 protein [Neobacillus kokaensis]GHH97437.1 glycosyltransferase WbuB [Neobacillus kokaensis]
MKKVLIITQHFYPEIGSHANRMKHLYMLLKKKNLDVTILTTEPSYPNKKIYINGDFWDEDLLNKDTDHIRRISIKNRKYSNSIFNRLMYYLEIAFKFALLIMKDKHNFDYIFVTSPPIFTGFVGLFAKFKYRCKMILDVRDLWPESLKGVGVFNHVFIIKGFEILEKLLYKKADKIVINSLGFEEHIKKIAGVQDLLFIPNGSIKEELAPLTEKKGKTKKIIYAGNLGLAQNTELIDQLVPFLEDEGIKLTIIGYGVHKKQLIESIKDHKNVTIINPLTKKECFKIIADHDLGLVTLKDKEVFKTVLPGKIIDYMTCGVPIVGIVDGYAKDVINNEEIGLAINEHEPKLILEHIKKLLDDDALRSEMSHKAQQVILSEFNWEININKLVEYIK